MKTKALFFTIAGEMENQQVGSNENARQPRALGRVVTNLLSRACKSIHDTPSRRSVPTERRDLFVNRDITRLPRYRQIVVPQLRSRPNRRKSQSSLPLLHSQLRHQFAQRVDTNQRFSSLDRNPDVHNHVISSANPQQTVQHAPRAHKLKVFRRSDWDCHRVLNHLGSQL